MKNYFLTSSFLLLLSCGGTNDESFGANETNTDTVLTTDGLHDSNSTNSIDNSEQIQIIPLKEKNQITDYVEHFLGGKVFEDKEKMDFKKGDIHFYEILDVKNGFARVTGYYEASYDFAVWRMANGNDLVGKTSKSCGPVCDYAFNFFEIANIDAKDVTETILPMNELNSHSAKIRKKVTDRYVIEDEESQLIFMLPQKGTSMDVYISMNYNEIEFPILNLSWNKEKFVIAKKIEEIPVLDLETR